MATQRGPDGSVRLAISGDIATLYPWACIGWVQTGATSNIDQSDLDNLVTAWESAFITRFGPHINSNTRFQLCTATAFYGGIHAAHSNKNLTGSGTGAGAGILDTAASLVVSWNTSVYWRGGKPRMYLPSPNASAMLDGSTITPAEDTALTAAASGFHNDVNGFTIALLAPIQHGFVSFRSGNQPRPTAQFFPILGANIHPRLGTQRRRLGKWKA